MNDVLEKFSSSSILHHKIQLFAGLDDFIKLNDVRMSNYLEDVNLSGNSFNVVNINDLVFFEDFHSHFFSSQNMSSHFDFPEGLFA